MIQLTEREAQVLEQLRLNKSPAEVDRQIGVNISYVITNLLRLKAIERIGHGKYLVKLDKYEISNEPRKPEYIKMDYKPIEIPEVSDEVLYYIKNHLKVITRSELARRLGIKKQTLLNILLLKKMA